MFDGCRPDAIYLCELSPCHVNTGIESGYRTDIFAPDGITFTYDDGTVVDYVHIRSMPIKLIESSKKIMNLYVPVPLTSDSITYENHVTESILYSWYGTSKIPVDFVHIEGYSIRSFELTDDEIIVTVSDIGYSIKFIFLDGSSETITYVSGIDEPDPYTGIEGGYVAKWEDYKLEFISDQVVNVVAETYFRYEPHNAGESYGKGLLGELGYDGA